MPTQKICLKWNSFQSNILTSFENLWEEEGFVDVTLASEGQCIRAHKVILSACSPFFKKIFEANPCQHPVIILQDVHFSEVESLLNFVYKGEVHIDEENLPALLQAAETLQIRGLSGASDQLKQKTTVLKKSTSHNNSAADGGPPSKRMRHILKSPRSPGQPSVLSIPTPSMPRLPHLTIPPSEHIKTTPFKSTFVTKEEILDHPACQTSTVPTGPQHLTTPPAEHSHTQPYELTFATKQELLDHEPSSPDHNLEETYDESNEDSMDLMAKHMAMEAEQLNVFKNYPYPPFPCPFCDRAYTSWGFRRRHVKAIHTLSPRLSCKWCVQVLPSHSDWEQHVIAEHALTADDARNGLLILEEAHMVLQIPNPTRLDELVKMIKQSSSQESGGESGSGGTAMVVEKSSTGTIGK